MTASPTSFNRAFAGFFVKRRRGHGVRAKLGLHRRYADHPEGAGGRGEEVGEAVKGFPSFATFGENLPTVIRLTALQVNLPADLAAWSVTNRASGETIMQNIDDDILPPPGTQSR